jgi:cytochrome c553
MHVKALTVGVSAFAIGIGAVAFAATNVPAPDEPFWAWGWKDAAQVPPPAAVRDTTVKHSLPASKLSVTEAEANDRQNPPDWYPEDHSPMPNIVAHGDAARMIYACGLCHLPNGLGRAENANVAGLPVEYFRQQLLEFKNDQRVSSDPRKTNTATMTGFAKVLTDKEVDEAAAYFAQIKLPPDWVKVVEAATVPITQGNGSWSVVIEGAGAGTEPIGNRIVETPVNPDDQEKWRNPRSGFIAYVPPGSIAKGKQLVESGSNGRFTACTVCHGTDLRGIGPIPTLAGRSPSYIARQLYDMQNGNRSGPWTQLMAPIVAALQPGDILNLSAYIASLKP